MPETISTKKGYLNNDFNIFHLRDKKVQQYDFHYHDFDKIVIFLSGKVTYIIEGKSYVLKPWDILLVRNHNIHKPIIDFSHPYERIIIWADPAFIERHNYDGCDLSACFKTASEKMFSLIRLKDDYQLIIKRILSSLEQSVHASDFGSRLLSNTLFLQLLIYINRICLSENYSLPKDTIKYDKQIENILIYINCNLTSDLSIELLCSKFYVSRYYLMHKFKNETGYTIHSYILQKRTFKAAELIEAGIPKAKAAAQCGFNDYSTFHRAYKKYTSTTEHKPE